MSVFLQDVYIYRPPWYLHARLLLLLFVLSGEAWSWGLLMLLLLGIGADSMEVYYKSNMMEPGAWCCVMRYGLQFKMNEQNTTEQMTQPRKE